MVILQCLFGRARQFELLRLRRVALPCGDNLFGTGLALQFDAGTLQMAFASSNTIAVGADNHWRINETLALPPLAQHLERLHLDLLLFSPNIRDDVIKDLVGG